MKPRPSKKTSSGLAYWMEEVPREAARAADGFGNEAVHDLRVALRRCRSMAEGFRAVDPDKEWKRMRRQATELFDSLGELRDCQVMMEWVQRLGSTNDPIAQRLLQRLGEQEPELKRQAENAMERFDRRHWQHWNRVLPQRTARLPMGSEVFQVLALEKLNAARRLESSALKTHTPAAFHRLRIALKKFRYVVENFLPQHHEAWKDGLKNVQDLLGEIHDLDVLREAVEQNCSDLLDEVRRWEETVQRERTARIERYRETMGGDKSLWLQWRSAFPRGPAARNASLTRLQAWSSFLDSDVQHSRRVASFAVQIYQGLASTGVLTEDTKDGCDLLRAAAVVHEVGRAEGNKNHHKKTGKLVGQLDHLVGWTRQDILSMAQVARYHRGALPRVSRLQSMPAQQRRQIKLLAGVLRLANALDAEHDGAIRRITIAKENGFVVIRAEGLLADSSLAEKIAGARHLLEITCRLPILVQRMPVPRKSPKRLTSN
ncbi:MAG TPA: CHAD domain-containing protein [Candidatus Angelobacter sp.]